MSQHGSILFRAEMISQWEEWQHCIWQLGCTQQHVFVGTETFCFWAWGKCVQGASGKIPLNVKTFTGHLLSAQNVKERKRPSEFSLASSELPESCLRLNELPILWIFIADLSSHTSLRLGRCWADVGDICDVKQHPAFLFEGMDGLADVCPTWQAPCSGLRQLL